MSEKGQIGIVGAMYDIANGKVEFYSDAIFINDDKNPSFSLANFRT